CASWRAVCARRIGLSSRSPAWGSHSPTLHANGEDSQMSKPLALDQITIHPVVEQQGPFMEMMKFFPSLGKEQLHENSSWLQPEFVDREDRLVICVQSFLVKTPHHNILVDTCVGNHKPRPARPAWHMMNSDRFEKALTAAGVSVGDIDYVMCTHLHTDH